MTSRGCNCAIGLNALPECTDYNTIKFLFQGVVDPHSAIKSFVRSGVLGFVVDAFTCTGHMQPVHFRLSQDVDAFTLASYESVQSCNVKFADISNIYMGDEAWIQNELGQSYIGLDSHCAVLELGNGNCLALRFRIGDWADNGEEAKTFVRCMQTFMLVSRR